MPSQTYHKDGHIHGRFNRNRFTRFDKLGKDNAEHFLSSMGWVVEANDISEASGNVIYNNTDQKATRFIKGESKILLIEAAVKRYDLWKYIGESTWDHLHFDNGVDVETRKLKYIRPDTSAFVIMTEYEEKDDGIVGGNHILMIPMDCLVVAQEDCGDEYKGSRQIPNSKNFLMPVHGCHRVRKCCRKGFGQNGEVEDFYRIPYEYIARFERVGDKYKKVKASTMQIERGEFNGNRPLTK